MTNRGRGDLAEVLMVTGVARGCPDCQGERIFVSIDDCDGDICEYCCTTCGAAVLIDPAFETSLALTKVA